MWCDSQRLVILANFPKKYLFGVGTILKTIMQPYSRDLLRGNFFEMTWPADIQQLDEDNVVQLSKKIRFQGSNSHAIWDKIMQSFVS